MIGRSNVTVFTCSFSVWVHLYTGVYMLLSAIMGHHRHRRGRRFTHSNMLLLHRQEVLFQKEEEQEGQEGEG